MGPILWRRDDSGAWRQADGAVVQTELDWLGWGGDHLGEALLYACEYA